MIHKTIIWQGLDEYHTTEHCMLTAHEEGIAINGTVIGGIEGKRFSVDYFIEADEFWHVIAFSINYVLNDGVYVIEYTSDGRGNWFSNGEPDERFTGCNEIDISVTPFTNTLPVKRLGLQVGEQRKIKVLYIDILEQEIKPVEQLYTRLGDSTYKFENVADDFKAEILFDADALVVDYPGLFKRVYSG
jgi:hypothetical protein